MIDESYGGGLDLSGQNPPRSQSNGVTLDNHAGPSSAYVDGSLPSKMHKLLDISDSEDSDSMEEEDVTQYHSKLQ